MKEIIETALLAGQLSKLFADGYQWCDKDAGSRKMQAYSASRNMFSGEEKLMWLSECF